MTTQAEVQHYAHRRPWMLAAYVVVLVLSFLALLHHLIFGGFGGALPFLVTSMLWLDVLLLSARVRWLEDGGK
jgi:uncharacterized membrane protein